MLKKSITYTDYNGNTRTEDFFFNLTQSEVVEMELSISGGLTEMIQKIVAEQDHANIVSIFKDLVLKAYGEKSLDGKYFLKKDENGRPLSDRFAQTEAYSVLFMELASNAEAATNFFSGIIPTPDKTKPVALPSATN